MPVFERCRPEAIPSDCVIVHIWTAMGRTVADVACVDCRAAQDYLVADFPRPVPLALERAEEVRRYCRLSRIVVVLDGKANWQDNWGELKEPVFN